MKRISDIEILGTRYPLNFSVKAAKAVDEKFGSLDKVSGIFGWEDISTTLYNVHWLLKLLLEQGAAYKKLVEGEAIEPPSEEVLGVLIGPGDIPRVQAIILESIGLSIQPTVEVEIDEKNAETTQG